MTRLQVGQRRIYFFYVPCAVHLNVRHKIHTFPNCARPCIVHARIILPFVFKSRIHVAEAAAAVVAHAGRMFETQRPLLTHAVHMLCGLCTIIYVNNKCQGCCVRARVW